MPLVQDAGAERQRARSVIVLERIKARSAGLGRVGIGPAMGCSPSREPERSMEHKKLQPGADGVVRSNSGLVARGPAGHELSGHRKGRRGAARGNTLTIIMMPPQHGQR